MCLLVFVDVKLLYYIKVFENCGPMSCIEAGCWATGAYHRQQRHQKVQPGKILLLLSMLSISHLQVHYCVPRNSSSQSLVQILLVFEFKWDYSYIAVLPPSNFWKFSSSDNILLLTRRFFVSKVEFLFTKMLLCIE